MEENCDQLETDPMSPNYCVFEQYDEKYAVTWISFFKPVFKDVIKGKSLQSCIMTALNRHNALISVVDEMIWGHEVKYKYKSSTEKARNKFVWRNPGYIERN